MNRIALAGILLLAALPCRGGNPDPREVRDRSIASFEALLERYPDTEMQAPSLLMLGNLYAQREKESYLDAVARHDSLAAAGEDPGEEPVLEYAAAIDAFRRVAAVGAGFPGHAEALHALGVCCDEAGRTAEAESCLVAAAEATSSDEMRAAALLRLGDLRFAWALWAGALEAYEGAREAGAGPSAQKLDYRTGWCLLKGRDYEAAGARFRSASDRAWSGAGDDGEAGPAEILRSLALVQAETNPSDVNGFAARFPEGAYRRAALVALGITLLDRDRPEAAAAACREALSIDAAGADAPEIHDRLVEALTAADRKEEAGREMEALLAAYGPGAPWYPVHGAGEAHRERLLRHAWNGALLRFRAGSDEDLAVAADLFETYAEELGGAENRSRARLFAAEAKFRLGDYGGSAALYDRVDPDAVPDEDREEAFRGAVLAHEKIDGHETPMGLAAIRYAEAYPASEEAAKALLLAAERLEAAGKISSALGLCERVAERGGTAYRNRAEAQAAALAARLGDRGAAEEWFRRSAESAKDEKVREERLERAAASALLIAAEREEQGLWAAAAEAYHRVTVEYPGSAAAGDGLLGEAACRIRFGTDGTMLALADRIAAELAGQEEARETLRRCAAEAAGEERHGLAAGLLGRAFLVAGEASDLGDAGGAWEMAGNPEGAALAYAEMEAAANGSDGAPEAAERLGRVLARLGRHEDAAAAFDRSRSGRPDDHEVALLAADAWLAAGEEEKAEERYRAAAERAEAKGADDLAEAKARLGLARILRRRFDEAVPAWRAGGNPERAGSLMEEAIGAYRSAIALRFEGITEEAAREASVLLERYGRAAFLREWDRGRVAEASVVDPWFADAAALAAAAGEPVPPLYADLADTLARRADDRVREVGLPPDAFDDFEKGSDLLARYLAALEGAEVTAEVAAALLEKEETSGGGRSGGAKEKTRPHSGHRGSPRRGGGRDPPLPLPSGPGRRGGPDLPLPPRREGEGVRGAGPALDRRRLGRGPRGRFPPDQPAGRERNRIARRSLAVKRIIFVLTGLFLVVGAAGVAAGTTKEEEPRRQVVDLNRLEIEGEVPVPTTLFIRERGPGAPHELFALRRSLPPGWLRPVVKSAFDRETWNLVDRRKR
ncbi:MAG: hypothetical protein ABIK65_13135 [Candidatus Eisenbacteria bacterium]